MKPAITSVAEMAQLKAKLKTTWTSGDFDKIAQIIEPGAVAFMERLALKPGVRVLDVACGTGNLSFPAARAGAIVTGVDIAPNLLATARTRARAEGLQIQFDEGDAEQLPYTDASFDVVVTMFGAMFAPQPEVTAAELRRVCRPDGQIAMANWTATGFIGQMFKTTAAHVPPPNFPSPLLWGDETTVRERLQNDIDELQCTRRMISFRLPMTPEQTVDYFRTWYGPTLRAFAALDESGQAALHRDLTQLWSEHNQATDGTTHVEAEYLEVMLKKGKSEGKPVAEAFIQRAQHDGSQ
ncbi:MAG: class I SAM-dependent methyltransferase [Acidobacteria bacterium]|nr:class I SAM-dependent methyltransferase [Acidobacteriota bacterium]